VVLVELEQVVDGQVLRKSPAAPGECGEHSGLADGMVVIELAHAAAGGALKHQPTYGKSKPGLITPSMREAYG